MAFVLSLVFMYADSGGAVRVVAPPDHDSAVVAADAPFALLAILIFNQSLNIFSALGLLVLFGVVKKNSILQIDHAESAAGYQA